MKIGNIFAKRAVNMLERHLCFKAVRSKIWPTHEWNEYVFFPLDEWQYFELLSAIRGYFMYIENISGTIAITYRLYLSDKKKCARTFCGQILMV